MTSFSLTVPTESAPTQPSRNPAGSAIDPVLANTPHRIGKVMLTVRDLDRVSRFYQDVIGLRVVRQEPGLVRLGTGTSVLLELRQHDDDRLRSPREAGLFHTAFLLPSRADLGSWAAFAAERRISIHGASDHGVSEAIYLADSEGNGIEIYADRPSGTWLHTGGMIEMPSDPLNLHDLLRSGTDRRWSGFPHGGIVGHMHLAGRSDRTGRELQCRPARQLPPVSALLEENGMLVNGKWSADWHPVQAKDAKGGFVRQTSSFRSWVTPDGSPGPTGEGGFEAERGRYHLYVALICPWASRTLIARTLKRLEDVISISVVEPALTDEGWRFGDYPGASRDAVNDATYLHEIYTRADPTFTGRATVPVLWDKQRRTIVNNESAEIVRMLNAGFGALADDTLDLYPDALRAGIDALNARIYPSLNNGVYRAGFATTQEAYEEAFWDVFGMLDELEARLEGHGFLFGDRVTETDIRLFVTLVRFDAAYHGLFKCNLRRIADYPNLSGYMLRVLAIPGVAATVNIDHIKRGYYSIKALNPNGIVPAGPALPFQ